MKVRINATGDTIVMKFVRPSPDVKLEGYILGYGGSMFTKQFIQLPENGQPYQAEMGKTCRFSSMEVQTGHIPVYVCVVVVIMMHCKTTIPILISHFVPET